jgi:hypothetical protein
MGGKKPRSVRGGLAIAGPGVNTPFTVFPYKNPSGRGEMQMSAAEWTHLSVITDRLGSLEQQAQAAAAAGDFDRAIYFSGLIKTADQDRQRIVERIFGDL